MHTITKKLTYAVAQAAEPVMDIRVTNNRQMSIHALTSDAAGGTLTSFYVFIDPISGEEIETQYTTKALAANTLGTLIYDYKVDFIRLKYTSGGAAGTIYITGTTSD